MPCMGTDASMGAPIAGAPGAARTGSAVVAIGIPGATTGSSAGRAAFMPPVSPGVSMVTVDGATASLAARGVAIMLPWGIIVAPWGIIMAPWGIIMPPRGIIIMPP